MRVPWVSLGAVGLLLLLATMLMAQRELVAPHATAERATLARHRGVLPPQGGLIIPVQGVVVTQLVDTWGQARAEGRTHEGIDILAPQGTPVLAAVDGRIVKFFDSVRGGTTIYEFDREERFVYYYAHLSARAASLSEGEAVLQGQVIGYVGMTGNAPVPHLHFEIERLGAERHWWRATALNPYPLLRAHQAPS